MTLKKTLRAIQVLWIASRLAGCGAPPVEDPDSEVEVQMVEELPLADAPLEVEPEPVGQLVPQVDAQEVIRHMRERSGGPPLSPGPGGEWREPVDQDELERQSVEALYRACVSEEGWASPVGCQAIWQTMDTIRGCLTSDRREVPCRDPEATRERASRLAALRRFSRYATGAQPSRTRRQRWVSTLRVDCEEGEGWPPPPYAQWRSYQPLCERLVPAVRAIVEGDRSAPVACPEGSRPIAWGCSPARRAALCATFGRWCGPDGEPIVAGCNDTPIAMRRGLDRLDCGETENAFWCRPGTPRCGTVPPSESMSTE